MVEERAGLTITDKVTFILEGFAPYRIPLLNLLATKCDLKVIFLGKSEPGREWSIDFNTLKCEYSVLAGGRLFIKQIDWAIYFPFLDVIRVLKLSNPSVVIIGGWSSPGYWAARFWCITNQVPMLFWSESHVYSTRTENSKFFCWIKSYFLKPFKSFYAFSPLSSDYLTNFGISPERITCAYNLPNVDNFKDCSRLNSQDVPTLLYVGQLIERKGVENLFKALSRIDAKDWRLIVAGNGELKEKLEAIARKSGFLNRITFLGYVQQGDMPNIYREGDILLVPSFVEVWGLVIHEALLSGVFVIGSKWAAASHALLSGNLNGELVDPNSIEELAVAISRAIARAPFDRNFIRSTVSHIDTLGEVNKLCVALERAVADGG